MTTDTAAPTVDRKASFTGVAKAEKEDTKALVTTASDTNPEDPFSGMYLESSKEQTITILSPPFVPGVLKNLTTLNNALLQCVDVMKVNIDGTGHTIEPLKPNEEDKAEKEMLEEFFDEPYPGKSMISIRQDVRDDLESTGNGYMEMIRTAGDDLVMMDHLESCSMRLCRLDEPVFVEKIITRKGKELKVKVRIRERRFVQVINTVKTYFKEFGASRDVNRFTGKWAEAGQRLPVQQRGSEVIHLTVIKDAKTPYGLPRWINQLPSILGSRKAEEFNLEFFDSGGLPPVLVVVQGGYLGEGVKESLHAHLGGKGAKHRAAIVEAISSSGSLDSSGSVKVTVERFGAERQQDSMFQNYDKNAEEHVRNGFRLPPLFLGKASDYNFATAMTGYMTAEAQVFGPERLEFDEAMWWVCKALGAKKYTFKSKPMNLTNIDVQLKAIQILVDKGIVEPEDVVKHINAALSMALEYKDPPPPPTQLGGPQLDAQGKPIPGTETGVPGATPQVPGKTAPKTPTAAPKDPAAGNKDTTKVTSQTVSEGAASSKVKKAEQTIEVIELAERYAALIGLRGPVTTDPEEVRAVKAEIDALDPDDRKVLNHCLSVRSLVEVSAGALGLQELCGIATTMN